MLLLTPSGYNYFTLSQQSADYACSTIPHSLTGSNQPLLTLLANPVIAALLVLNTKRFSLVAFCSKESMIVGSALLAKLGNKALCYYKHKQSKAKYSRNYSSFQLTTEPLYTFIKAK